MQKLRVLIACEFSGRVRQAFRDLGHAAYSCDLLPSEDNSPFHIQGNVLDVLTQHWDLMVAHPPCTHLACSGARWFKDKKKEQAEAIEFFMRFTTTDIPHTAIENPIGIMSSHYRKPDGIYHPYWFGHGETKATCLWLKGLPMLKPTRLVSGRKPACHLESPGPDRWKNRSRTLVGVARAIARQWSEFILTEETNEKLIFTECHTILFPDDVARLKTILNKAGFDASDRDIEQAWLQHSNNWCAQWLRVDTGTGDHVVLSYMLDYLKEI